MEFTKLLCNSASSACFRLA
ncbi:hypothetical protein ACFOOP_06390 [Marinicaulis aureus]|uniref:Uncharacterized protein n=1 Tax=Hyphococcus aureus TaxID=2666033 RepID=A0ABW1KT33_9PROT